MTPKNILIAASLLGATGVIAGAFGAHALRDVLTAARLQVWETAVRYQMYHALALLVLAGASTFSPGVTPYLWLAGVAIFSGSLYALCLTNVGALGAITPIGGLFLIAGWVSLGVGALRAAS